MSEQKLVALKKERVMNKILLGSKIHEQQFTITGIDCFVFSEDLLWTTEKGKNKHIFYYRCFPSRLNFRNIQ